MSPADDIATRTARWLEEAIIGLDLCPFAARVHRVGGIRIATYAVTEPVEAVEVTLNEARDLLSGTVPATETILVAITAGLEDFATFLDVVATVAEALAQGGAAGLLQVATFHPDYVFAGEDPDALGVYTNRAPCPVLHLLREEDVSEAIDRHPDPVGIPTANIARLEAMGPDAVRELWQRWSGSA